MPTTLIGLLLFVVLLRRGSSAAVLVAEVKGVPPLAVKLTGSP